MNQDGLGCIIVDRNIRVAIGHEFWEAFMKIYETEHFVLESAKKPEIDRLDGGHIKISPKDPVEDRTKLTSLQSTELEWLTSLAGEAFAAGMAHRGAKIGRINYQDNGNWNPALHVHLYGRAIDAKMQKYGDPIKPGYLPEYSPLDDGDVEAISEEIRRLERTEKYNRDNWRIV